MNFQANLPRRCRLFSFCETHIAQHTSIVDLCYQVLGILNLCFSTSYTTVIIVGAGVLENLDAYVDDENIAPLFARRARKHQLQLTIDKHLT